MIQILHAYCKMIWIKHKGITGKTKSSIILQYHLDINVKHVSMYFWRPFFYAYIHTDTHIFVKNGMRYLIVFCNLLYSLNILWASYTFINMELCCNFKRFHHNLLSRHPNFVFTNLLLVRLVLIPQPPI